MNRIEGVEAILGYCAFNVSSCAVIEEDHHGGKYGTDSAVVHHQREGK